MKRLCGWLTLIRESTHRAFKRGKFDVTKPTLLGEFEEALGTAIMSSGSNPD
jgi:hypothetical protein